QGSRRSVRRALSFATPRWSVAICGIEPIEKLKTGNRRLGCDEKIAHRRVERDDPPTCAQCGLNKQQVSFHEVLFETGDRKFVDGVFDVTAVCSVNPNDLAPSHHEEIPVCRES